ncbi:MAG: hypothetical protein R2825_21440 [Saprospiraceae bacterium]|jgi:hypothetical protein
MNRQKKFAQAAQRRKYFAFFAAVLLHVAIFAAISSNENLKKLIPDFIKEWVQSKDDTKDTTPRP